MLRRFIHTYLEPKALVLMYHRVAVDDADIWGLAVSPSNFEEQLQVLQSMGDVIPLREMPKRLKGNRLNKKCIAITFDDGYADNYLAAKPLLEKYQLPATFFITSCNLGHEHEFWWDELENLILHSNHLPHRIHLEVGGTTIQKDLLTEATLQEDVRQKHSSWRAYEQAPPTRRSELFLALWSALRVLPQTELQKKLRQIKDWAGQDSAGRPAFRSMTVVQLQSMARQPLFDIGAHTVTHPALGFHNFEYQREEMAKNKETLSEATGRDISLLAYPYGHYNDDSVRAAKALAFEAAFTTDPCLINKRTHPHRMGRFQVTNMPGSEFNNNLNKWAKSIN